MRAAFANAPMSVRQRLMTGDLRRLTDLGFTRFIVRYRGSSPEEMRRQIDRFVTEIVPKLA